MTDKEFEFQYALGTLSYDDLLKIASRSLSKYILTTLSKDEDRDVRKWVALNPYTPINVLIELSYDKNWIVRYWLADNPLLPKEVLIRLSRDSRISARQIHRIKRYPKV